MAKRKTNQPYNRTVSFKVSKEQESYIKDLKNDKINLRDVLEYYKIHHTNKIKELENREKELIREKNKLEKQLEDCNKELTQVRIELDKAPDDNQSRFDIEDGLKIVNERLAYKYKNPNYDRAKDFLATLEADRVLAPVISKYNIRDVETFKKELLDWIKF